MCYRRPEVSCLFPYPRVAVLTVFARWQDADASDPTFLLEQRTRILRALLRHERTLCYDLNAPMKGMKGVTPLGLAAWLNIPDAVDVLLHQCPGLVSVDGMDALGATPLMCKMISFSDMTLALIRGL